MDLDETLSRLLAGDLPEDEADALRARMANEPEVAERYAAMVSLVAQLEGLPEELEPPRLRRSPLWVAAGWLVAAAAIAWMLLPTAPSITTQTAGVSLYDGLHQVQAGDLVVHTRGSVGISVEPPGGMVREAGQEDAMKAMSHAIAAAAGALVTVTVYQGSAAIEGSGGTEPVALEAGEQRTFRSPGSGPASVAVAPARPAGPPDEARVAELEQELDRVREELGQERFAKILMKGQLEAERGVPTEWPEDVSEQMSPEGFERSLAELVAGIPDVELVQTDCEEYPCVGALRYTGPEAGMGWMQDASKQVKDWVQAGMGDQVSLNMSGLADGDGEDAARFMMFGAHADERGSNTGQRMGRRLEDLGSQLIDDAQAP